MGGCYGWLLWVEASEGRGVKLISNPLYRGVPGIPAFPGALLPACVPCPQHCEPPCTQEHRGHEYHRRARAFRGPGVVVRARARARSYRGWPKISQDFRRRHAKRHHRQELWDSVQLRQTPVPLPPTPPTHASLPPTHTRVATQVRHNRGGAAWKHAMEKRRRWGRRRRQ